MNIVLKSDFALPVTKYGGTERLIFWLAKELVKQKHKVFLIAPFGCDVVKYGINHILLDENWVRNLPKQADILHLFEPSRYYDLNIPVIETIGGNGKPNEFFGKNTVFVSKKHAENHSSKSFVYNAIDLEEYPFINTSKNLKNNRTNFVFLAKASWKVKNLKNCISVCKKNKKYLHVAGGRTYSFSRYIHSYGMLAQKNKSKFFINKDALLFPVRWHEPFGIAIIEAMAMGMPVIGSKYGSLPELVNSETGILCKNYEELNSVVKNFSLDNFDQKKIRKYVENNFSIQRMANDYLERYEKILSGEKLNSQKPISKFTQDPQNLLDF